MNSKGILRIITDIGMTVLLMLLMAFELVGRTAHEWIGMGLFVLFIIHHVLNKKWSQNLFHGKYHLFRGLQTILTFLVFVTMLGSFASAILISREVFAFLPFQGGRAFGRTLHMLCAYWGFMFMSLHLGFNWNTILGMVDRMKKKDSRIRSFVLRITGIGIALYGIRAFFYREMPTYLFLQTEFVYFDFNEPLLFFFLDYLAIMGFFIFVGYYLGVMIRHIRKKQ